MKSQMKGHMKRQRMPRTVTLSVLCLLLMAQAPHWAHARPQETPKPEAEEKAAKTPAEEKSDEAEKKPTDRYLAITGASVYTMAGSVLEGVTVLSKNGKIFEIGSDLVIPETAVRIDAQGYQVYPGLIALRTSGLVGSGDPEDSTNVYGLQLEMALAGGLTTVVTGNTAAKLTRGTVEGLVLKRNLFESIDYSTRNPSRRRSFRGALERVRKHLRDLEEYEEKKKTDPETKKPDEKWIRGDYSKAMKLIKHEATAQITANSAHEIRQICGLASHYDLQVFIQGAREAWTVAGEMGRAGVSAVVTPRDRRNPDERTNRPTGSTIQNASALYEHGVPIAITTTGWVRFRGKRASLLDHGDLQ